jgi:RNA polymerase sigma-70 factor (ECF subfamily)
VEAAAGITDVAFKRLRAYWQRGEEVRQLLPWLKREVEELAFESLDRAHGRTVWAVASKLCGDEHAAEGIRNEAFIRLWQQWQAGEEILFPLAWLLQTARRQAIDHTKSAARRLTRPCDPQKMGDLRSSGPSPLESAHRNEETAALRAALATLTDDERDLLVMRYTLDMTIREIADEIQLPRNTVWCSIARILRRLRPRLAHLLDPDMDPGLPPGS